MAKPIYIWDTDTCIYWLKGKQPLMDKAEKVNSAAIHITSISLAELKFGAHNSEHVQSNLQSVENMVKALNVLPFNQEASDHYGRIKARLHRAGRIIEDMDLLIASITLANEGILVTNNTAHFDRIKGLKLENWMTEKSTD